jgi:curved DNA-binding protein CbpA
MSGTLEELLLLFDLKLPLNEKDIKLSKKKVLLLHPDKNKNVKNINDIFIKYKNAYQKLEKLNEFTNLKRGKREVEQEIDTTFKDFIEKNEYDKNNKEFIKQFNKMFDNVYVKTEEEKNGYSEWLKSDEDIFFKDDIERSRKIIMNNEIIKMPTEPEYYDSKEKYCDLKQAHINTLIPIDCEKVLNETPKFKNVNEYNIYRKLNEATTMSEEESKKYLQKQYHKESEEAIQMAFKYKMQEEKMEKNRRNYYSKFLIIE